MSSPKKSLGQHWLRDQAALAKITQAAAISKDDTVLEIGPGLGTLTAHLVKTARQVVAVELDRELAHRLANNFPPDKLMVINADILHFDPSKLPNNYKVVANIPYYLTGKILTLFTDSRYQPAKMVLLVQKEVAERICAGPGEMSILAVAVQLYFEPSAGQVIQAKLFEPPPKVDSQILVLNRRREPLFTDLNSKLFFKVVRAGFSEKRKKLRSSLAGGLGISKKEADNLLKDAEVSGELRAQNLSFQQWHQLYLQYRARADLVSVLPHPRNT